MFLVIDLILYCLLFFFVDEIVFEMVDSLIVKCMWCVEEDFYKGYYLDVLIMFGVLLCEVVF